MGARCSTRRCELALLCGRLRERLSLPGAVHELSVLIHCVSLLLYQFLCACFLGFEAVGACCSTRCSSLAFLRLETVSYRSSGRCIALASPRLEIVSYRSSGRCFAVVFAAFGICELSKLEQLRFLIKIEFSD